MLINVTYLFTPHSSPHCFHERWYSTYLKVALLSGTERSPAISYDNAGEQTLRVITPLVAVLAVINTFVMALLAIAFITDTGMSLMHQPSQLSLISSYNIRSVSMTALTKKLFYKVARNEHSLPPS